MVRNLWYGICGYSTSSLLLETRRYKDARVSFATPWRAPPRMTPPTACWPSRCTARTGTRRRSGRSRSPSAGPDHAHHHYVRALILLALKQEVDSMTSILEALRLDNTAPQYTRT